MRRWNDLWGKLKWKWGRKFHKTSPIKQSGGGGGCGKRGKQIRVLTKKTLCIKFNDEAARKKEEASFNSDVWWGRCGRHKK